MAVNSTKDVEVESEKEIYVVWQNTDLTEGKGSIVPRAICELEATAKRLAKGTDVQGTDCRVTREKVFWYRNKERRVGYWYGPVRIEQPTKLDEADQKQIDRRNVAVAKAREAGLSEDDIKALGG